MAGAASKKLTGTASAGQGRLGASPGVAFALVTALITGSFMVLMPLVVLGTDPVDVGSGLPSHKQNAESLLYLLTFFVLLPFWLWQAPKLADHIIRGANSAALGGLTASLVALLAAAICLVRISSGLPWNDGLRAILAAGIVWCLVAGVALFRASRETEWKLLRPLAVRERSLWLLAAGLVLLAALTPVRFDHVDLPALLAGMVVLAGVTFAYGRVSLPDVPRGWMLGLNGLVVLLILLAVPDMVILPAEAAAGDLDSSFAVYIIQFHQNLWLGAASQIQGGSALLVDTVSQYGIAPVYLAAAFFELAPLNHTTLGFFDGALSAGVFATGFLILRAAGVRTLLASVALAVGVVALVWDLTYPMGGLLQHGALRFGLPVLLVAFQVAGARWPRFGRAANLASLAVVGLSSVWALEAFLYVSVTWLALLLLGVGFRDEDRMRWLVTRCLETLAAWVVTQVIFLLLTLAASGSLPDWGLYLNYLRDFLTGDIGELTYDFTRWSRGFLVAMVYLLSAAGIALLALRVPGYARGRQPAMVALAGLTGYGIGLFSYYDNRSLDHVLPYVSLPALLIATIWLALVLEDRERFGLAARRGALAVALASGALLVAVAWPAAGTRSGDSLLAYVIPGGPSLADGFERIWDPPEFTTGATDGAELVNEYLPGAEKVPVLARPDLDVEILTRSDRINSLGITDAKEMSWVPGPHEGTIDDAVDTLLAGDLMIVDEDALAAFDLLAAGGSPKADGYVEGSRMEPIQNRALARIAERFRFEEVESRPTGVTAVRLEPR